ncbi:MAG: ABC transporter permease [Candidatus Riflebacteria bacterium]|nr:ABC transporter permease [Bacteroidales bacterium]MCK9458044.1 ABC transporter permease [Candidatus Riflebacteria bacterium]MDD3701085.1 ABC transporter permease [Bacteroidales bacterium]MDY0369277.1 ABC transporter permease [Bacteroidales bacterium]
MLRYLLEKEFKQIFRNAFISKVILVLPVIYMLIFPWVVNQEIKNLKLSVVDNDRSTFSERLIHKVTASGYFHLFEYTASSADAIESVDAGKADIILEIPRDFEKNLYRSGQTNVMISANAVNGMKGGLGSVYLSGILNDFAGELTTAQGIRTQSSIVEPQFKFNPTLDYKVFMIPAIFVMLLTLLTGFLPALNIVSEKEMGTTEQLNVTPMNKAIFILAKLIPYWIMGILILTITMGLAALLYGLIPGSFTTIYLYSIVYILAVSGLGIVISNNSDTMQQAMFVMFFLLLIIILLSGLFSPISSMPEWAQAITAFNPLTYFIIVMRAIYLKGSGMQELLPQFFVLCGFAVAFNVWAVLSYKKSR